MVPSDYCRFEESIKEKLRQVQCDTDWDDCATKVRQIAQDSQSGTWGVVVVGNKEDILNEKIEWHISSINPEPSRCRLLINDTVLVELFRTGYRAKDIKNDQRQWIWTEAKAPNTRVTTVNICPHSSLREIVSSFSIKQQQEMIASSQKARHGLKSMLHASTKGLANVFFEETGHYWNVFIIKNESGSPVEVGFNLPHYVYDARAGFCIGRTVDGYTVNAATIGFANEHAEIMSRG
uniref:Uncharacterized protein n=1 Tax=Panagrolaimus superbus TaxID=310955 RepID=A0A914Z5P4_9BILA